MSGRMLLFLFTSMLKSLNKLCIYYYYAHKLPCIRTDMSSVAFETLRALPWTANNFSTDFVTTRLMHALGHTDDGRCVHWRSVKAISCYVPRPGSATPLRKLIFFWIAWWFQIFKIYQRREKATLKWKRTLTSESRNKSGINPRRKQPTNIATDITVIVKPPSMMATSFSLNFKVSL